MSRRDLSVKGGTSQRCYRTRRGRTDEQRYAIISLYFDGRIKMNGPYPEITNISFLAKLFFKIFISLKHLSDYRTVGLSDYRTVRLSDCQTIGLLDYSYGPQSAQYELIPRMRLIECCMLNIHRYEGGREQLQWVTFFLNLQKRFLACIHQTCYPLRLMVRLSVL
jgi:hypothetical protein